MIVLVFLLKTTASTLTTSVLMLTVEGGTVLSTFFSSCFFCSSGSPLAFLFFFWASVDLRPACAWVRLPTTILLARSAAISAASRTVVNLVCRFMAIPQWRLREQPHAMFLSGRQQTGESVAFSLSNTRLE